MGWWRGFFAGRAGDLDEEIRAHLEMAVQDRVARGEAEEAARAAVRLEFGNVALVKDVAREMRGWGWMDRLLQDLRYATRQLRKSSGFTVTALLTIALAVGANTTIFSLGYALLLRSLPVEHPEQLVQLKLRTTEPEPMPYLSTAMYEAVMERQRVFSRMCAWEGSSFSGEQNGEGRDISSGRLSGDCFAMLGLRPVLGRLLTAADDKPGLQTAVISYAWWETRFHRDPGVIGKKLVMVDVFGTVVPLTIVGVLPASFQSMEVGYAPSLLQPLGEERNNNNQDILIFARLREGVTTRQAEEQIGPGFRAWVDSMPANGRPLAFDSKESPGLEVSASRAGYSGLGVQYKKPLLLLQILVGLLLLASCAYLGTLFSARSVARRREIALRAALGASRGRLVRQLFSEGLLLAFAGSAAGVLLAWMASRYLMTLVDADSAAIEVGPGRDVLVFTLVLTGLSVVMWGLIPALRASRVDVVTDMRSGAAGLSGGQRRVGRWLVPVQIALSLIVVVVAGLLSTTLARLLSQNNGYRMGGTVFASTDFPFALGKEAKTKIAAEIALQQSIVERLNHAPGVGAASIGMIHVLAGGMYLNAFSGTPSFDDGGIRKALNVMNYVGPRYFSILGTKVLRGREFSNADTATSQPVCVLTRAAARHFFPGSDAVGRTLYSPGEKDQVKPLKVIGVVEDMRYEDLRKDAPPIVYLDFVQVGEARNLEYVMKTGDPAGAVNSLREILRTMAPGVHVSRSITMEEQVDRSLARERLLATLSAFFAGLGLLLGSISVYGMLSYSVNCRTAEIGVRMALGATRGNVVRMIVGEASRLVVPGLVVGAVACAATTRLLRSLLYETKALDPLTSVMSVASIVCVALVASWLPARRASRVDPMEALRAE